MIYLHYDEETGKFLGWYDDEFHNDVPSPTVEVIKAEYLSYNEMIHTKDLIPYVNEGKVTFKPGEIYQDWFSIRIARNGLLNGTDWTQLSDVPDDLKAKYANYRKALRDMPQTYEKPEDVVWPKLSDYGISE